MGCTNLNKFWHYSALGWIHHFTCWQWYSLSTQWQNAYFHQCGGWLIRCRDCGPFVEGRTRWPRCSRNANASTWGGARFYPPTADPHRDGPGWPPQTAWPTTPLPSPSQTKPPWPHSLPVPLHHLFTVPFCPISITSLYPFSISALRLLPLSPAFPYSFTTPPPQDGAGLLRPAQPW